MTIAEAIIDLKHTKIGINQEIDHLKDLAIHVDLAIDALERLRDFAFVKNCDFIEFNPRYISPRLITEEHAIEIAVYIPPRLKKELFDDNSGSDKRFI